MFPTNEEFNENKQMKQESVMKWRDVPQNTIFKINNTHRIDTPHGEATILTLESEESESFKCWAIPLLADRLTQFGWRNELYVRSLGLVPSRQNPSFQYYAYELYWNNS